MGCIVSRSDEAKQVGVQMAGPYFMAKPLIEKHDIAVFSSNYTLYGDLSWRVMETLRMIAGASGVEVYSVGRSLCCTSCDDSPAGRIRDVYQENRGTMDGHLCVCRSSSNQNPCKSSELSRQEK